MRRTLLVAWGAGVPSVVTPVQGHLNRLHRSWVPGPAGRAAWACGPAGRAPGCLAPVSGAGPGGSGWSQ